MKHPCILPSLFKPHPTRTPRQYARVAGTCLFFVWGCAGATTDADARPASRTDLDAIYAGIEKRVDQADRETDARQLALSDRCRLTDFAAHVHAINGTNVWTEALQAALDQHEIVVIPPRDAPYFFHAPVRIPSNRRIEAAGATLRLVDGTCTHLLSTASAQDGTHAPLDPATRADNIALVGGCWEDWSSRRQGYGRTGRFKLGPRAHGQFFGVSTLIYLGHANHVLVKDVTFRHTSGFAVQAGDGDAHRYENIVFDDCFADGLHLNGNLTRVHARRVRGRVGDDLVALNAYDWLDSSINFGPQRDMLIEDLALAPPAHGRNYPAIRILPACYRYADGRVVDCAISNVIFRRVTGVETFKMYLQTPRYTIGGPREWAQVGSGGNLFFEDITIDLTGPIDKLGQYNTSDPVRGHFGAFEFGANLSRIILRNIDITFHADTWPRCHLATVGPKSIVLRDPRTGRLDCEIFDPYVSCTVDEVHLDGIRLHGTPPADLVHTVTFDDVNRDGASSGRGVIRKIIRHPIPSPDGKL